MTGSIGVVFDSAPYYEPNALPIYNCRPVQEKALQRDAGYLSLHYQQSVRPVLTDFLIVPAVLVKIKLPQRSLACGPPAIGAAVIT